MLQNLLIATVSAFALGTGSVAMASDYRSGMDQGAVAATCAYLDNGMFRDQGEGRFVLRQLWHDLDYSGKEIAIQVWTERDMQTCLDAVLK